MLTAAAYAAAILVIAGCGAYAATVLRGHQPGRERLACLRRTTANRAARILLTAAIAILGIRCVRGAILRARWAWRCRGCPPRNDGQPLGERERGELITILRGWGKTARPERSRT